MEITTDIYGLTRNFPKNEMYGLVSQMNRCAVSMPSNIAEGSNREVNHFKHFLNISLGSSFELQTKLIIATQIGYIEIEKLNGIENKLVEFQKMTAGFIKTLN